MKSKTTLVTLGNVIKMGKFEDAERIFQLHPKNTIVLMDMALMYLEQCDDKQARECFLESKKLPPTIDFDFSLTLQFLETKIKF
jgi:hypothetical protein